MKKKLVSLMISAVLAVSMLSLTACGGEAEAPAAPAEVETEEVDEEPVMEESEGGCSDEVFEALQDDFVTLTENYDLITNYYLENEDIPQDDDVEEALSAAKDAMDQMGEITQDSITDEEAIELENLMIELNDALKTIAEGLDLYAASGAATDDTCSDENFAALQEAYEALTTYYDIVEDYYLSNDDIPQSDDVEEYLNAASGLIDEMGNITQDSISNADAEELADAMVTLADSLEQVANAL